MQKDGPPMPSFFSNISQSLVLFFLMKRFDILKHKAMVICIYNQTLKPKLDKSVPPKQRH